jgi:hypothetical protein
MSEGLKDRDYWVETLVRITRPVLEALAQRRLKELMPVEGSGDPRHDRRNFSHLEALARSLAGIAPWLACRGLEGKEEALRRESADLARRAIDAATDPASPDFVNFGFSFQPIVDAAFLCHAILRAPGELLDSLDGRVRDNLAACLLATRSRKPHYSNWLLFGAMIEAGLARMGLEWDRMRVDYALRQHEQWYKGDGAYGDGPEFHWDYYNSYVIQPMLVDIAGALGPEDEGWSALSDRILRRARRYAEVQERLVAPDGSFPPLGRSLAYRCGAFQHLAQMALQHRLPEGLAPEQVRGALNAVIRRTIDAPGTFDEGGWLRIGLCGSQSELGEMYISTGSLYLCTTAFLPLGLGPSDPFWSGPAMDWTAKRIWSGGHAGIDHALDHEVV